MPNFRYTATDENGQAVHGEIEAADAATARQRLLQQQLSVNAVEEIRQAELLGEASGLNTAEALEFGAQLSDVVAAQMPLAPGLRAVAEELDQNGGSSRLVRALSQVADRVEAGMALGDALTVAQQLPESLRGVIAAGARCGRLDETLACFVDLRHRRRRHTRLLWSALGYPMLLLSLLVTLLVLLALFVTPLFGKIYQDFGAELPYATKVVLWLGEGGVLILGYVIVLPLIAWLAIRLVGGRRALHRTIHAVPLVGELVFSSAMAESSRLLSTLLRQQVPLPEALQMTGRASRDGCLGPCWQRLAADVNAGAGLADSLRGSPDRLESLAPVIGWSERNGNLDEAFDYLATTYEGRAEFLADYLRTVVPPFVFLLILFVGGLIPLGLLLPMIKLVQSLT